MKALKPVLKQLSATSDQTLEAVNISGLAFDSREVRPGYAFVCLPGAHVDGNEFVADAVKSGAACIVSERAKPDNCSVAYLQVADVREALAVLSDYYFDSPSRKLRPLGVTGTNGKTTVTHLIEHILNHAGKKTGLIGTLGARWPGQESYHNVKHTTPQSADLHRTLAQMVEAGCSHVSMEVSSHALVQKRVGNCHFAAACLTNITQDHLDFHQTMERYWKAKRLLFQQMDQSLQSNKSAVINADDELANQFLLACPPDVRKFTYSWEKPADLTVKSAEFSFSGTRLSLSTPSGMLDMTLRLTGRFNVYNAMAAMLMCHAEGVPLETCASSLKDFGGVSGRFEVVSLAAGKEPLCIVDYAHTPDGLDNVLKTARALVPNNGKLIVVFGCGGDRDASKRPQMGELAQLRADEVIVTCDNPRSEDPQQIIANILAGIKRINHVKVEPDRSRAIRMAVRNASPNDIVLVAGKGHENYQILADRTIPFDDRTEVRQALQDRLVAAVESQRN